MPLSLPRYGPNLSPMLSIYSREGGFGANAPVQGAPASAVAPQTQTAWYYPIMLPVAGTAYKFWWLNGTVASTNNVQVGLYADDGTTKPGAVIKLGTSTLASGTSVLQYDDITDTLVGPGLCWLAIWIGGTTTTLYRANGASMRFTRTYQQASLAGGLPSPAVPATINTGFASPFYVFGIQFRSSP